VNEHRFRRVRYLKNDAGKVTRVEPRSIAFTDLVTGAILDVVDGRRDQAVRDWIGARPRWWRNKVELVTMDMSEFRRAVRKVCPRQPSQWIIGMWWRGRTRWSARSGGAARMTCTAGGAGQRIRPGNTGNC
jgi:hypothetical protein